MAGAVERGGGERRVERLGGGEWVRLVVLTLSSFIVILDSSVVFIALPAILRDLGGTLDEATFVLAGFILSFAVFVLFFGKLGDVYGRRLMFVCGVCVFTVASLACAVSPSIGILIGARVVQGVGAAMVEPSVLALIKTTFPKERLGLVFGVQGIAAGVAASAGPILGGIITTGLSWEYIFLINAPVGVIAVVGALLTLPESRAEGVSRRLDVAGLLLSAISIFLLVFAIVEGGRFGWGSEVILGSFVASAVLLALFVVVERRVREPLVDLALFRDRLFAVGNILRGVTEFGTLGIFFALALFLQVQLGYSALQTGLQLLPLVAVSFVISPLAGSLSDKLDARWLVVPGLLLVAVGVFWLAHVSPQTGWTFFIAPLALTGAGLSMLYGPTTSTTLRNVPPEQSGVASSVSFAAFLLGSELGLSLVGAVLQSRFAAKVREALSGSGLSRKAIEEISPTFSEGAGGTAPRIDGPGAARIEGLIQSAFADAVNAALLGCVAVALLGAVIAALFFSGKVGSR